MTLWVMGKNISRKTLFFFLVLISHTGFTQELANKTHSLDISAHFQQFKDQFNYGLVFSGGGLAVRYKYSLQKEKSIFEYTSQDGFGINSGKGAALNIQTTPVDLYYGYELTKGNAVSLKLGGYISVNYNWQLYPQLQSGHMFWFSSFELGPRLHFTGQVKNGFLTASFSNTAAGMASRPIPETETYFYSLKYKDFIKNAHNNLKFGSGNLFNRIQFEISWKKNPDKKKIFAYRFEYFEYNKDPKVRFLIHSLMLRCYLAKTK